MTHTAQGAHLVAVVIVLITVASMQEMGASRQVVRILAWSGFAVAVSGVVALAMLGGWSVTAGAMAAGTVVAGAAWHSTRTWPPGHPVLLAVAATSTGAAITGMLLVFTPVTGPIAHTEVYTGLVVASVAVTAAVAGAAGVCCAVTAGSPRWSRAARGVIAIAALSTVGVVLGAYDITWWASVVIAAVAAVTGAALAWSARPMPVRWIPTAAACVCAALTVQGVAVGAAGVVALCGVATGVCVAVRQQLHRKLEDTATTTRHVTAEDAAVLLASARRAVVVPGFVAATGGGLAHVQAMVQALNASGVNTTVVAHSEAGILPGTMAYLVQELNLPPEQVVVDPLVATERLASCDVVLVAGQDLTKTPAGFDCGAARHVIYIPGITDVVDVRDHTATTPQAKTGARPKTSPEPVAGSLGAATVRIKPRKQVGLVDFHDVRGCVVGAGATVCVVPGDVVQVLRDIYRTVS